MAAFDIVRPAHIGSGALAGLVAQVTALVGKISEWNDARVTRNALSKLSDRELEDIGLVRGDIENICGSNSRRS